MHHTPRPPRDWRLPTPAETSQDWRTEDAHRYLRVQADFDGDGLLDHALLLVNAATGAVGLFVFQAQRDATPRIHLLYEVHDPHLIQAMGIVLVPPGTYRVICDGTDTSCGSDGRRPFSVTLPALGSFKAESASSLFYWNATTKAFEQAWSSD